MVCVYCTLGTCTSKYDEVETASVRKHRPRESRGLDFVIAGLSGLSRWWQVLSDLANTRKHTPHEFSSVSRAVENFDVSRRSVWCRYKIRGGVFRKSCRSSVARAAPWRSTRQSFVLLVGFLPSCGDGSRTNSLCFGSMRYKWESGVRVVRSYSIEWTTPCCRSSALQYWYCRALLRLAACEFHSVTSSNVPVSQ